MSTLGTGAANYPSAPVPKACMGSGPPRLHWAIGQKRATQRGCHAVWDDLVIIITNTAIIFINLLLVLGVSSPGLAVWAQTGLFRYYPPQGYHEAFLINKQKDLLEPWTAADISVKHVVWKVGNLWESSNAICYHTAIASIGGLRYIVMVDQEYDSFLLMI